MMATLPGKRLIASAVYFLYLMFWNIKNVWTITIWIIIGSSNRRCYGKNGVLKDSCSESDHVKFAVKSLEKYLCRTLFLVKLQASSEQLY